MIVRARACARRVRSDENFWASGRDGELSLENQEQGGLRLRWSIPL